MRCTCRLWMAREASARAVAECGHMLLDILMHIKHGQTGIACSQSRASAVGGQGMYNAEGWRSTGPDAS